MVISKVFQIFAISLQLARATDSVSELTHVFHDNPFFIINRSGTATNLPSLVEFLWKVEHTTFIQKVENFETYGNFQDVDPGQLLNLLCNMAVNNQSDWENFQKKNWELFLSKLNPEALTAECFHLAIGQTTIWNKALSFENSELVKMILDKLPEGYIQNFTVWNKNFTVQNNPVFSHAHLAIGMTRNVEVRRTFFEHKSLRLSDFVAKTKATLHQYLPVGSTCLMICLVHAHEMGMLVGFQHGSCTVEMGIVVLKAHFTLFLKERLKGICDLKMSSRIFNWALRKLPHFPSVPTETLAPDTESQGLFTTISENVVTLIGEDMMKDIVTTAADDFKTLLNKTKNKCNQSVIEIARCTMVRIENATLPPARRQEMIKKLERILDLMENPVKLLELP